MTANNKEKNMEYRTLGRSGLKVSVLTMGTFTFGGTGPFAMVGQQGVSEARRLRTRAPSDVVSL